MGEAKPYPKSVQIGAPRKKYRRKVASAKTWEALRDARLGPCLLCQHLGRTATTPRHVTLHHVVPKGSLYNGDDVPENLVPLCGSGTSGHHGLIEAGNTRARGQLAEAVQQHEPDVYAYAIEKMGESWYRYYRVQFRRASGA